MKPLLEDFKPVMSSVYDECLKGTYDEKYLEPVKILKEQYGITSYTI